MNPEQVKRASRLIEDRKDLRNRLDHLHQMSNFPVASLTYYNNSGIDVRVSVPPTLTETVEALIRAILEGQVTKIEGDLRALGVEVDD